MARKKSKAGQAAFEFPRRWGGRREGAGRRPKGERAGVSHRARARLASCFPVHVTMRLEQGLPSLRRRREHRVLLEAFHAGCDRGGFRLVHFSVQSNHLHLLVEGKNREALSRGIQGLAVRVARRLNRLWSRMGRVFADRYHDRILRSPREVWDALRYVLNNARKHRVWFARSEPDPYSSGRWFDGWRERGARTAVPSPFARARTWMLRKGWRKHGLLRVDAVPAGRARGAASIQVGS